MMTSELQTPDPSLAPTRREIVQSLVAFNDRMGLRQAMRSVDYFRCLEVALAVEMLSPGRELRLLDMGCGTGPFSLFLRVVHGPRVTAFDLDPRAVSWQLTAAERIGETGGRFQTVCGDSRSLPFDDESFDLVLNLSSIEHIPEDGDLDAAGEMSRMLAPGGRAVLTVPYGPKLVEREGTTHTESFERRYDEGALNERLISPSGLNEVGRIYFGEPGFRFSRFWFSLPALLRLPLRRLVPILAQRFLHPLRPERRDRADGVCLSLMRDG